MTGDHNIRLHRIDPRLLRIGDYAARVDEDGEAWSGTVELVDGDCIWSRGWWHQMEYAGIPNFRIWYRLTVPDRTEGTT